MGQQSTKQVGPGERCRSVTREGLATTKPEGREGTLDHAVVETGRVVRSSDGPWKLLRSPHMNQAMRKVQLLLSREQYSRIGSGWYTVFAPCPFLVLGHSPGCASWKGLAFFSTSSTRLEAVVCFVL